MELILHLENFVRLAGAGPSRGRLPMPLEVTSVSGRFLFFAFFFSMQSARDEPFVEDLIGASKLSKRASISGRTSMTSSPCIVYLSILFYSISLSWFGKYSGSSVLTMAIKNSRSQGVSPWSGKLGRYRRIFGFPSQNAITFSKVNSLYRGTLTLRT